MNNFLAHILVVDDDDGIRKLVKQFLNENNYLVTTAQSAEEAQSKIKIIEFDLIVLDLMMSGKSRLEFLIENKNKEEIFISPYKGSFLELISTDWKPVFEIVFSKLRNKDQRPNQKIVFEEFISVKGIKAQGNQLTPYKVKQVNILEPLEFIPPIEKSTNEIEEVVIEDDVDIDESEPSSNQATLF